jgi:hypothetical protein
MKLAIFIFLAGFAIVVHYFVLGLRYAYYVPIEQYKFLQYGYAVCIFCILLLWIFYPSRILVAIVAFAGLVFPNVLGVSVLGNKGIIVPIDWAYFGAISFSIFLLVCATELRRRL